MLKMELREGTEVYTPNNDQVGRVTGFVLDPSTNEITHLIIQKGWLFAEDRVIPFDMVRSAGEDRVVLKDEIQDINQLPLYEETHFIRTRDAGVQRRDDPGLPMDRPIGMSTYDETNRDPITETGTSRDVTPGYRPAPAYIWYPPSGYVGYPVGYYGWPYMEKTRNIPEGTVPLKEGTDVISSDDKHVGDVERVLVDPDLNRATHLIISQGLLFKDRKLVPAHWVRSAEEDKVHLSVSSEMLEDLPAYEE